MEPLYQIVAQGPDSNVQIWNHNVMSASETRAQLVVSYAVLKKEANQYILKVMMGWNPLQCVHKKIEVNANQEDAKLLAVVHNVNLLSPIME